MREWMNRQESLVADLPQRRDHLLEPDVSEPRHQMQVGNHLGLVCRAKEDPPGVQRISEVDPCYQVPCVVNYFVRGMPEHECMRDAIIVLDVCGFERRE